MTGPCAAGNGPAVKGEIFAEDYDEEEEDQDDDAEGSNGLPIKLSSNRWADVSEYNGSTFISIREYYEVRGALTCQPPAMQGPVNSTLDGPPWAPPS